MRVRAARLDDMDFVRDLGAEAFAPYGRYGPLLPDWFMRPGVLTFVAEHAGKRAGFAMLAFYEARTGWIGDLLAIAVSPSRRCGGLGTALIERVVEEAGRVVGTLPLRAIELSVADSNSGAQRLFERHGFRVLDASVGYYDGGQRTIRMGRLLPKPATSGGAG